MSEVERIVLVAFGVALQVGCVRWGRLDWREPLRERTPVEVDLMTRSILGIKSPAMVHAQYRVGPVRAFTGFFLILGGELALLRAPGAAIYAAFAVGVIAAVVWLLVLLLNRPRWAVPPGVRNTVGIVEYKQREPRSEPEFRDPRAVPPPSPRTPSGDRAEAGDARGQALRPRT